MRAGPDARQGPLQCLQGLQALLVLGPSTRRGGEVRQAKLSGARALEGREPGGSIFPWQCARSRAKLAQMPAG